MAAGTIEDLLNGRYGALAPGDVFAFRGSTDVDKFIQTATLSEICHVAVLYRQQPEAPLLLLEATGAGVTSKPVADALRGYDGKDEHHTCFYLPLTAAARAQVDDGKLAAFAGANAGDKYNYAGTITAGVYDLVESPLVGKAIAHFRQNGLVGDILGHYDNVREEFWQRLFAWNNSYRRLFCSQLVAAALQAAGVAYVPAWPNPRSVVPVQVCTFPIFDGWYQLNDLPLDPNPFKWGEAAAAAVAAAATPVVAAPAPSVRA